MLKIRAAGEPEYPEFKPLELGDQKIILPYLELAPRRICELSLANLFIWKDFDRPQITLLNQNLCLYLEPLIGPPYFLEPLGRHKLLETAEICLKHAGRISRASQDFISLLPQKSYHSTALRDQFDYVYSRIELAELKGRRFDGKRNHIKKFKSRYPEYKFIPLEPSFKNDALRLFKKWFEIRKESKFFPKLAYNAQKNALISAFDNFGRLSLLGGAILMGKSLKGFILGSALNSEMVSVHFMYGDPDWAGISPALLWEASRKTFSPFTYLNLEQDLGIPGLRKFKLSYHPLRLEKKFEICRRL